MTDPAPLPAAPVQPRLRLEFSYEFDDFVDAQTAASTMNLSPRRWWRGLLGWVLFIGLAIMLFMLMNKRQRNPPRPVRAPPPIAVPANDWVNTILLPVIPWLLIFGFIWFFVFRQIRKGGAFSTPKPESMLYEPGKEPSPPKKRADAEAGSWVPWALIVLPIAAVVIALGAYLKSRSGLPQPIRIFLPMLPWVVVFVVIFLFLLRQKSGLRALWDAQPALHRPQVVEVYDDRIVFTDAVGRYEHAWEAFTHVRETPGALLLFTSQYSMHILPKRVFPGRAEIDAFRDLVRRTIAQRPAPAFPVVPAG